MHTPATIRRGESYLFPKPAPKGTVITEFIKVVVREIRGDQHGDYVILESDGISLQEKPHIGDFCADVNISELMSSKPA